MGWYHLDDGQFLFNRSAKGFIWWLWLLFMAVVYSPLLFLAYWIDTLYIPLKASGLVWLAAVLIGAAILYAIIFILKGVVIGLRRRQSYWWIPLFLICVAATCILPAAIVYPIFYWITGHLRPLSWLLSIAFGYFVYGQYNFLNQRLPFFSAPRSL